MKTIMFRNSAVSFAMLAVGLVAGCSTVKEGFIGDEHENILPFAEQTVASMAVERIEFRDTDLTYIRALADPDSPEIQKLRQLLAVADEFRDEIVYYSVEIVRVSEMVLAEEDKVLEYADTLEIMRRQFNVTLDVSDAEFGEIVADVRSQATLLAAFRAVQPLIDRVGDRFEHLIREIEEQALVDVVDYVDDVVEAHYAVVIAYNDILVQRRDELLTGLSLINDYRRGDELAMNEFQNLSLVTNYNLEVPATPSVKVIESLEISLLNLMETDNRVTSYLQIDIDAYLSSHEELNREEAEIINGLSIARTQIVAWTRAHQAMANGARDPGKWLKIAMEAAGTVRQVRE
jgi:hypothetical protein